MSLLAAAFIDRPDSIYSFEPDAIACQVLRKNLSFNNLNEKVTIFPFAVYSYDGLIEFNAQDGNSNSHINNSSHIDDRGQLNKLECLTLNSILESTKKPDLIKIDTEGAEIGIIKGASKLLQDKSVKFICELHPFAWEWFDQADYGEFVTTIESYGRTIQPLDSNMKLTQLPSYSTIIF